MEKTVITFNDLPEVVAQLRDEVMSLRSLLTEQRSVNNAKTVHPHTRNSPTAHGAWAAATLRVSSGWLS